MPTYANTIQTIPHLRRSADADTSPFSSQTRLILSGGRLIDPKNNIDRTLDIALQDGRVCQVADKITAAPSDRVLDCSGLVVMPGLLDMHLHLGDLFDVYESPLFKAAVDGVTLGLSPGAGNTFMAPSLLGAEVDRGLPLNVGVYLGAGSVLASQLDKGELIAMFRGELDDDILAQKMTRNAITNSTAHLTIGIKDHMGHFILPDAAIEQLFDVTTQVGLVFMSHTQDPEHAQRMARLSKGRPLHLAHATAAGCGTHTDGLAGMQAVLDLVDGKAITAEFVSSMLLPNRGRRDGLKIAPKAQELAYRALQEGLVKVIISDGQSGATMKGFGNTADNLPCLFTLEKLGILSLPQAIACMTCNTAELLSRRTGNAFFEEELGHLAVGARANLTVADPLSQSAVYTIVNGQPVAFEGNLIREGFSAGCLVSRAGFSARTGVGDLALYK
ncbi:MAG: dihydroorotase [Chloroflexota bacterium]|nr:dihydroorotase [Chloroflexota bacterium]